MAAAVLSVAASFSCYASEQTRRFPLELEVLAANAHDLLTQPMGVRQKHGLRLRMASSLGTLRFLARQYLLATHKPENGLLGKIDLLRKDLGNDEIMLLARDSRRLTREYPVILVGLTPGDADSRDLATGHRIYQHLCLGCHEYPDTRRAVPATNLFNMAAKLPPREFMARLITGVHGKPAVALHNPFSNREIAGLAAFLARTKPMR
jgi:hypothetical protein